MAHFFVSQLFILAGMLLTFGVHEVHAIPKYVVDLDLPPEQRWLEAVQAYKNVLPGLMHTWGTWLSKITSDEDGFFENHNFDEEYVQELQGIVDAVDSPEVTLKRLILFQMIYEFTFPTFCSGILAADPSGNVLHSRNMDYVMVFKAEGKTYGWQDITFEADFRRSGQTLFKSVGWIGHIGIHTAVRPGGWTFEQNTRRLNHRAGNLAEAKLGGQSFAMAARRIMEEVPTFAEAIHRLESTHWMAPQYFIVSGPGKYEGAVLTMDRQPHGQPWTNVLALSPQIERWFIVQTNDDLSTRPPVWDPRRDFAEKYLSNRGQATVSATSLQRTMRTPPLFCKDTVYTWVADVRTGETTTVLPDESVGLLVLGTNRTKRHARATINEK